MITFVFISIINGGDKFCFSERQRKYKREGLMKTEKYERLKAVGFDFGGPKQEKKPWMKQYESLVGKLAALIIFTEIHIFPILSLMIPILLPTCPLAFQHQSSETSTGTTMSLCITHQILRKSNLNSIPILSICIISSD